MPHSWLEQSLLNMLMLSVIFNDVMCSLWNKMAVLLSCCAICLLSLQSQRLLDHLKKLTSIKTSVCNFMAVFICCNIFFIAYMKLLACNLLP